MRIGINALYLLPGKVGGSEIYLRNLVRELAALSSVELVVFVNRESRGVFTDSPPRLRVVECPVNGLSRPARILFEQFKLPRMAKKERVDVLLSAGMTAPFKCPVPSVVVIFDLQHINQPENYNRLYLVFLRSIIYMSARASDGVITISEKSRSDIARHYRKPPEDIKITRLAADNRVFYKRSADEVAGVRRKYDLPERFVLYIASSLPHKNYKRLLGAFKRVRDSAPGVKLVLIGARDYGHEEISARIKELGLEGDVVFLGWLPFEDIPLVYSAAEVFVFPSLHEGFGIPVLEAFATGVPVVCSRIDPITEVAGDAARFIDPFDEADMAEGILSVMNDAAARKALVDKGLRRSRSFSWWITAKGTLEFLERYARR